MFNRLATLLFLVLTSIVTADILTTYREYGVDGIEKKMDLELTKTDYWEKYLEDKDTTFGYIESYNAVLTCDKEKSTLALYKNDHKNKYTLVEEYNAFTGKMKGDKYKEGDLKTPIGIYNIEKKISKLDSFYGPMAFVTSYPNTYDQYLGKNGSGIWIHGLPTEQERDDYTKGCIAIDNEKIMCLDKEVNIDSTILIIYPDETKTQVSKKVFAKILANLYEWRYSWIYNDINQYLSYYSKDFKRFDGMEYSAFAKYKTRIFEKQEDKTIIFNDINVIPYPNTKDLFQITFKEFYSSNSYKFEGNKILMVKIDNNGHFQIITEK